MRPEARRRFFAAAFFSTLAIALAAGQEGGAFGLSAANLAKLLAGKDVAPALSIDDTALADTGSYGPAAYYYLGRWMESRYPGPLPAPEVDAKTEVLYRIAFEKTSGLLRRAAGSL